MCSDLNTISALPQFHNSTISGNKLNSRQFENEQQTPIDRSIDRFFGKATVFCNRCDDIKGKTHLQTKCSFISHSKIVLTKPRIAVKRTSIPNYLAKCCCEQFKPIKLNVKANKNVLSCLDKKIEELEPLL